MARIKVKLGNQWIPIDSTSLTDAPADGKQYVRQNNNWLEVIIPDNNELSALVGNNANNIAILTNLKVDKVDGKNLSTNDYTNEDKAKVNNAISDAPIDGKLYVRQDGKWVENEGGGNINEKLKVNLLSNQTNNDLNGVIITVEYSELTQTETWSGNEVSFDIPPMVDYTVSVSNINGYTQPNSQTFTSVIGGERSINFTYNTTIITVNISGNLSSFSGGSANVNGTTLTNGQSINIPTGENVTLSFTNVTNYKTPETLTFTASGSSMTKSGEYKAEKVSVTLSSDNGTSVNGLVVTINNVNYTYSGSVIEALIPFGTVYSVSVNDKSGFTAPNSQSFTANGASRSVNLVYNEIVITDLSKVDIHGNSINQTSANCYVVKQAGDYLFPLIYGAAIKNGATNSAAYTKNSGSNSTNFVNALGNQITSPYIETDLGETLTTALLSIADTDNIISNISVSNGYVNFTVNQVPDVGANAIISVKNSAGTIVWNWHIWLWSDDLTPVTITNATSLQHDILPVNLGSKWDSGKTRIKNWFYQWGRPTPLVCPSAYNSTTNATTVGSLNFINSSSKASSIADGIKNPTTHYCNSSSPYNWFGSASYYNLWDAACTTTGTSDNAASAEKTVYDPCPVGYMIPTGKVFTGFSTSNVVGSFDAGYKFKRNSGDTVGVFFPDSGYRGSSSGSLGSVGSDGYVWSSAASSLNRASYLYFTSGRVDPENHSYRAYGFSVRPVSES